MASVWAVAELADGQPTRLTLELATLAATLATDAGGEATVVLVGGDSAAAATIAAYGPAIVAVDTPATDVPMAATVATSVATLIDERHPDIVLVGATPDGKDVAGSVLGLTDLPVLVAASLVRFDSTTLTVQMSTFGGRLVTTSSFDGGRGIIIVRPGAIAAVPASQPGAVEHVSVALKHQLPAATVVDQVAESAAGPSIDDARVIVGAGRGIGGPDGLGVIAELADALGGAVGATRAAVDSGWIDFGQQIGQTGKTVKPDLYVACGVSGAIQHKVGIQSAGTIVAINKDVDAPIAEFADVLVVGDLFEVVPRLTAALRDRATDGS